MKKFFKRFLAVLIVLLALFFIIPLFMDTEYTVKRTVLIQKDKETVRNYVADFSNFQNWSPWAKLDSNMDVTIAGEPGKVGSTYSWEGNDDVGKGIMEITSISDDTVNVHLKFIEPFVSESPTYYLVQESEKGTEVTWFMEGEMAYPWNIMGLFMNMEEMIGKDFENGLNSLKNAVSNIQVEKSEAVEFRNIQETEIPQRNFIGKQSDISFHDIQSFYAENLPKIYGYLNEHHTLSGAPTGLYFAWNEDEGTTTMAAAIPIEELDAEIDTSMYGSWTLGGKALLYEHYGSYDSINLAHERLDAYMLENDLSKRNPVIEEYVTDPGEEQDTTKWQTNVYYLLKQ